MSLSLRFHRTAVVGLCLVLLALLVVSSPAPLRAQSERQVSPDAYKTGRWGEERGPFFDKSPSGTTARAVSTTTPICATEEFLGKIKQPVSALRRGTPTYSEIEPNNQFEEATYYPLGTGDGEYMDVRWVGDFGADAAPIAQEENDDSTGLANSTPFVLDPDATMNQRVQASGFIGDGLWGSSTGDFDFYAVPVTTGSKLVVRVVTENHDPFTDDDLDPVAAIFDRFGNLVRINDDASSLTTDSEIVYTHTGGAGLVYIMVTGYLLTGSSANDSLPLDATTDNRGLGGGADRSSGAYTLQLGINPYDRDLYVVSLRAGDVLSLRIQGDSAAIGVWDGTQTFRVGVDSIDRSGSLPASSPLLRGGNANFQYVVESDGALFFEVEEPTAGSYTLDASVRRPGTQTDRPGLAHQVLFVDFDGEVIPGGTFGGINDVALTSFDNFFITYWRNRIDLPLAGPYYACPAPDGDDDLTTNPAQEIFTLTQAEALDILKRKIMIRVREILHDDLASRGVNGDFDDSLNPGDFKITIIDSENDTDVFGEADVSRVIVGGTINQFGVETIGLANTIDPGNFSREDTAVVLMDLLSEEQDGPAGLFNSSFHVDPLGYYSGGSVPGSYPNSLNGYLVSFVEPVCLDLSETNWVSEDDDEDPETPDIWTFIPIGGGERLGLIEQYFFLEPDRNTPFDLIATGIGNIIAHEAVHFFGGYHTTVFNAKPNIIDEGGSILNILGDGGDQYFGKLRVKPDPESETPPDPFAATPSDDEPVYLVDEIYSFREGMSGHYDAGINVSWGLSTGRQAGTYIPPAGTTGEAAVTGNPNSPNVFRVRQLTQDYRVNVTVNGELLEGTGIRTLWVIGGSKDDTFNIQLIRGSSEVKVAGGDNVSDIGDLLKFEPLGGTPQVDGPNDGKGQIKVDGQGGIVTFGGIETLIPQPNEIFGVVVR